MKATLLMIASLMISTVTFAGPAVSGGPNERYGVDSYRIVSGLVPQYYGSGEYITKIEIAQDYALVTSNNESGCVTTKKFTIKRGCNPDVHMMCLPQVELTQADLSQDSGCQ